MEATPKEPTGAAACYRVILEGIASEQETPDSFALKLSTRMHASFPRVRSLVDRLPCVVKKNVTVSQAKRLQAILEELGARVRVEAQSAASSADRTRGDRDARASGARSAAPTASAPLEECPNCGWELEAQATHCPLCLRKFRDASARPRTLGERLPERNPLETGQASAPNARRSWKAAGSFMLLIVIGAAVFAFWILVK